MQQPGSYPWPKQIASVFRDTDLHLCESVRIRVLISNISKRDEAYSAYPPPVGLLAHQELFTVFPESFRSRIWQIVHIFRPNRLLEEWVGE